MPVTLYDVGALKMPGVRGCLLGVLLTGGCQGDSIDPVPPVQLQGRFIAYAAADEYEVCDGTVAYAEAWAEGVARRLGIDPDAMLPITYYFVGPETIEEKCTQRFDACIRRKGETFRIFSSIPLHRHELVHAVQFSAWPHRQPLLHEGLAEVFGDDNSVPLYPAYSAGELDAVIEAESTVEDGAVYHIGAYLVYWMLTRYGAEQFEEFWHASTKPTTAEEFRLTFESVFGESLDSMVTAVDEEPHCSLVVCEGEPGEWNGGVWATESPDGCGGSSVYGIVGDDFYDVRREEIVEITQVGDYEISVSESMSPGQGVQVQRCDASCQDWILFQGQTQPIGLQPGLYRVTTFQGSAADPGVTVEIRLRE